MELGQHQCCSIRRLGRAALASEEPIQFSGTVLRPNERAVAAAATRKAQGDKGAPGSLVGTYDDAAQLC